MSAPFAVSTGGPASTLLRLQSLETAFASEQEKVKRLQRELLKTKTQSEQLKKLQAENSDLSSKLYEASAKLVEEGGKAVKLATSQESLRTSHVSLSASLAASRELLFAGINGGVADPEAYKHVSLADLIRLRLQEPDAKAAAAAAGGGEAGAPAAAALPSSQSSDLPYGGGGAAAAGDDAAGAAVEATLDSVLRKNRILQKKFDDLESRLTAALDLPYKIKALEEKLAYVSDRATYEKELRARSESNLKLSGLKVSALSDHIEKLMLHLKHEATSKAKAYEEKGKANRECDLLRARSAAIMKKNNGRERVIAELKEGAKILEDQLRLMDEKYVELRTKLDWTRITSERIVKKREDEARSLRSKFALAQGSFSGGVLLDSLEVGDDGKLIQPGQSSKSKTSTHNNAGAKGGGGNGNKTMSHSASGDARS